jgi:nucleotidyltransferase AbiEii toxin of type IV toxin-antitoxin system
MIDIISLSAEWLADKRKKYGKDPAIMESMIYALYLLEQIQITGLDFIFKGGTSLILLLETPQRFSVDIDIIISPEISKEVIEEYLSKITGSAFIRIELDEKRSYKQGIPKAHYKFIFKSNVPAKNKQGEIISNPEREILLDILFAENHYPILIGKPIQTEWLALKDEMIIVRTPDINSITGDKLTAFAPNTTGVPYNRDKEKEIMKQVFDIGSLFHLIDDLTVLKKSYEATAIGEIKYRPERNISSVEEILRDTIETAMLIARKDSQTNEEGKTKFAELNTGINQFGHFVYIGSFRIEQAQVASAKAAYLAAIILSDYKGELKKHDDKIPVTEYLITHPEYNFLNKRLKFVAKGEALFYWFQIVSLLFSKTDN